MKINILLVILLAGFGFFGFGCETVRTLDAPADATNIRKPADTTKPVRVEEGVIIERVY